MITTIKKDLDMMREWATSLCSRLDKEDADIRHVAFALDWFYGFAKSKIEERRTAEGKTAGINEP